jgi:peptidyl-prolyl cis-trans isomerase SurA
MQNPIDMIPVVRKQIFVAVCSLLLSSALTAQSLFTIDGTGINKEEFLKAYNKNNNEGKPTERSYRDYLELYIRYKLKVRAAYDMQLDTLATQKTELQNFRAQVADNYLKDEASLDKLVKEAFTRGQHDIHLAHIFIAIPKISPVIDTAARAESAYEKAMNAYNALKKGKKFNETALAYSDDPSVKSNGGDIGYITVFTLPYELESLAYATAPGQFSRPYRTKAGFHIFKNLGERRALGRMKVAQILLSFPPSATAAVQLSVRQKADSIYGLLAKGADFATLAKTYSGDNLSYQTGGELPEFGIGKYDSSFETAAFALDRDGAFTRPIPSIYGYHIIKRIYRKPFPVQLDAENATLLKQQVQNDPRIEISRKALFNKIAQQANFQRGSWSETGLWAFTDSAILNTGLPSFRDISRSTVLFSFGQQSYTAKGWLDYARAMRSQRSGAGSRTDKELFDLYMERMALEYYRNHLEDYNKDFAFQLTEFREGNLLFEIMQRKIWDKASADSTGLRNYYEAHKDKYWWDSSADALLFTCNNQKKADELRASLTTNPENWRPLTDSAGASVQADSGRYETAQIPTASKIKFTPRLFTPPVTNKADNTVSFAYILQVYNERAPRNYRDARGFVINDYQTFLEDQWIAALKKKYPIKIEESVFATLPR